jgi:large subunit ribosomal protein L20
MHGLKLANISLNRKVLADLAINEPAAFTEITGKAREAIQSSRSQ